MSLTKVSIAAVVLLVYSFFPSSSLPFEIEAIALAVALCLWLTVATNVLTKLLSRDYRSRSEMHGLLISFGIGTPIAIMILFSSDQFAVVAWGLWQLLYALFLGVFVFVGANPSRLPSRWSSDDPKAVHAIALQAGGLGVGAVFGLLLVRYAGPVYFVVFMSIGLSVYRFLLDEIIYVVIHGVSLDK